MSLLLSKKYPQQYPEDAVKVLNAMSFTKNIKIVGSNALRSQQYAGDYDAMEVVEGKFPSNQLAAKHYAKEFKRIIGQLLKMDNVYIGDIKCGLVEEWRVTKSQDVKPLLLQKIITPEEASYALSLLKDSSAVGKLRAKQELKFHIIRWTPQQIMTGKQTLRDGRTYTLQEAILAPTIAKLDTIALVQSKYTDFSIIYEFHNNGRALNPSFEDPEQSLRDSIKLLQAEGNRFKVVKRKFSLAKLLNTPDLQALHNIINSEAGKLYVVYSDVKTLADVLESHSITKERLNQAINGFKHRLSRIYNDEHFLKQEPRLLADMEKAERSKNPIPILRHIEAQLLNLLNTSTKLRGGYSPY